MRKKWARLRKVVRQAKQRWVIKMAEGLDEVKMKDLPRERWEFIYRVVHSFTGHHKKLNNIKMRMSNGELAQMDAQNVEILQLHFNEIFNGKSHPIDME